MRGFWYNVTVMLWFAAAVVIGALVATAVAGTWH